MLVRWDQLRRDSLKIPCGPVQVLVLIWAHHYMAECPSRRQTYSVIALHRSLHTPTRGVSKNLSEKLGSWLVTLP